MALVSYSDSEGSDTESPAPAPSLPLPKAKSSLSSFLPPPSKKRKLVDESNPGASTSASSGPRKIKIELPKITPLEDDEPSFSSSRPKIGKSTGAGMLSFLPAPKKTGADAVKAAQEAEKEEKGKPDSTDVNTNGITGASAPRMLGGGIKKMEYAGTGMDTHLPTVEDDPEEASVTPTPPPQTETKPSGPVQGRAIQPFFRKPATKKKANSAAAPAKVEDKKVSLFSLGSALNEKPLGASAVSTGEYKPMIIDDNPAPAVEDIPMEGQTYEQVEDTQTYQQPIQGPQTYQSISEEIGMDEASMRMFMGRRGRNAEIKLMDFNVDQEYEKNEAARAAGELAPEKNVVRSIKPGKHQLTSLLNAAQSQRTALEESFAQGRRNKKEAGSKYGW
ncbi:hypothetical protein H072_8031 [Dactylellina haptotyla CBS 200.50]|uniref:Mitotic checkpoint regulator, MAD2B-interacting-domain-containing protein n=1 Tax=Dactylellina haptotyla (strain CBS 200.50) TaxID=1284197 RepID=S8BFU4_DACHA|nr:hypothetical protein H072_8031 [Dactylellina haptotyla CBS 200.50]